jgi:hypothetical protein
MDVSDGSPAGFQLGLVEGWEIIELVQPTFTYIGLSDAPLVLATAHWRLGDMEHATGGLQLRAALRQVADGPHEAECRVSIYAIDRTNDPEHLQATLGKGGDPTDVVALPAGAAVRRTGRRPRSGNLPERFVHQFFVPVPGTYDEVVFLEFWSPSFEAEGTLRPHFEGLASSFEFTYAPTEAVFGDHWVESGTETVQLPKLQIGGLVRATFRGWPRRFTPIAHAAVALWLAAAVVIMSRVFVDADKGLGAIFDDIWGGAFLAFFGPCGYILDQYHDRGVYLLWLVMGGLFLWVAITCPEGRLGHLC